MSNVTFCPQCGQQFVPGANFCGACGASIVPNSGGPTERHRIVRPRHPRMLAGVCSGIAIHFGWDVALTRILFALFVCLTVFTGVIVYLVAWLVLPDAQYALPPARFDASSARVPVPPPGA